MNLEWARGFDNSCARLGVECDEAGTSQAEGEVVLVFWVLSSAEWIFFCMPCKLREMVTARRREEGGERREEGGRREVGAVMGGGGRDTSRCWYLY